MKVVKAFLTSPLLAGSTIGSLIQEQIDTETKAVAAGVLHYRKGIQDALDRGNGAALKPAERLLIHWFKVVEALITDEQRDCKSGKPGISRGIHGQLIQQLPADKLAFIVMHEALGKCMTSDEKYGVKMADIAYSVGRACIAEMHLSIGKKDHTESLKELMFSVRKLNVLKINWWARRTLDDPKTDARATRALGSALLHCLLRAASCNGYEGMFVPAFKHHRWIIAPKKQIGCFDLTPEAFKIIDDGHDIREKLRPRYLPMVVEPYPWQEAKNGQPRQEGGYLRIRTPLVSKPTKSQKEVYDKADFSVIFDHLNALGSSPLQVHPRLLPIIQEIWKRGGNELDIPPRHDVPKPPMPDKFENLTDSEKKAWKRSAVKVREENIRFGGQRKNFLGALSVAEGFTGAFWLPHQLCFRSRAYPIPLYLSHQGDDVRRGLIEAHVPVEPGKSGERWLRIHTANTFGFDDCSFADREEWFAANIPNIHRATADPMNDEWWRKAKKPFQFLAACFAAIDKERAARLPIGMDATCSGLQHYAMMVRDPETAASVNLMPGDFPRSAYKDVAEKVKEAVAKDRVHSLEEMKHRSKDGEVTFPKKQIAGVVYDCINKKTIKPNVMTTVYGVTKVGATRQVRDALSDPKNGFNIDPKMIFVCSRYLSGKIEEAMSTMFNRPAAAMAWIRDCARLIAEKNRLVMWNTPLGFPVVQHYRKPGNAMVKTILGCINLQFDDSKRPVAVKEQVDGSAPNVVHGVDGAVMFRAGWHCRKHNAGFWASHDCFNTQAGHGDFLAKTSREQMVAVHKEPLLDDLVAQWRKQHPDIEFPDATAVGTFDIRQVLDAGYALS